MNVNNSQLPEFQDSKSGQLPIPGNRNISPPHVDKNSSAPTLHELTSTPGSSVQDDSSSGSAGQKSLPPGYIIMPAEFDRQSTGYSVIDANSIHHLESGRTYHAYKEDTDQYFLPNDGFEQDRLDIQHQLFYLLLDKRLWTAPMPSVPKYVLDVATGTGIWANQFIKENPSSYVIGTDLSRIQPTEGISENVEFIVDDSEEPWIFPSVPHFDYVHLRMVFTCFKDPKTVMKHAFDNLRPGGWIEYQDCSPKVSSPDGSHRGTAVEKTFQSLADGLKGLGRDPFRSYKYRQWLRETGFVDVVEKRFCFASNSWPEHPKHKNVGHWSLLDTYNGMRGIIWKSCEKRGMPAHEIESLVSDFKRDVTDKNIRAYYELYATPSTLLAFLSTVSNKSFSVVVYGRKPFEGERVEDYRGIDEDDESVETFEVY